MRTRRAFFSMLGLATVLAATTALAPAQEEKQIEKEAKVGEPAPAFKLKDATGKEHALKDYKGKVVVLQWINYDCPVCRRVMATGVERDMIAELKKLDNDIVILAINSTRTLDVEKTASYLKDNNIEATPLIDKNQEVGRKYGAKTTPHLYVIDAEGVLRYNGAIDNGNPRNAGDTNYVVNAVTQILNGETVTPDTTRPYGCDVKYGQ